MTTLILSGRHTEDAQALWRVAIARGWDVVRARGITVPPLPDPDAVIYVEALYGPPIAAAVGRALLEPPIDWLPALSPTLRHRRIELATVAAARASTVAVMAILRGRRKRFESRRPPTGRRAGC